MNNAAWEKEYWNGNAAQRWIKHQHQVDRALLPFSSAMLDAARIQSGERVLDVGCGCGTTTQAAAVQVGASGLAVGIDVSLPMIEHARLQAASDERVAFICDDASTHQFPQPFDVLISRNGLMFFEKPKPALKHLQSTLRRGGRISFVAWRSLQENEWLHLPLHAVTAELRNNSSPSDVNAPSPFAFSDREYVERLLHEAGFSSIESQRVDAPVRLSESGVAEAVEFVRAHAGPVGRLLSEADDVSRARAEEALAHQLARFEHLHTVELSGAAWLITARV